MAYTLDGPPERMIASGAIFLTSLAVIDEGAIWLKTFASRTLRAINCAYCAPKSTTKTPLDLSGTMDKNLDALELFHI